MERLEKELGEESSTTGISSSGEDESEIGDEGERDREHDEEEMPTGQEIGKREGTIDSGLSGSSGSTSSSRKRARSSSASPSRLFSKRARSSFASPSRVAPT